MALIEILEIVKPDGRGMVSAAIDSPEVGTTSEVWSIYVAGWVLGYGAAVERVEFVCEGVILRTAAADRPRPDVAKAHKLHENERPGFSSALLLVGLPWQFEIHIRALLADGDRITFAVVRGRRGKLHSTFEPKVQPLMVTSILGRTGRTWVMHLLAQHPQIVANRVYPYETLSASYWLHLLKVLSEPANHRDSSGPDTFLDQPWLIGAHPYNAITIKEQTPPDKRIEAEWFSGDYVAEVARFCQASIEGYYRTIARAQGQGAPRYFAEKVNPWQIPRLMWDLYAGAREVFLVRDFRDMVCSVMAFNAKRGFASFGRERADSDAQYVRRLKFATHHLYNSWLERRDRSLFIRYEDMVLNPEESLGRILDYLELEAGPEVLRLMIQDARQRMPELEAHQTSHSPAESIGRWRRDLSPELQRVSEDTFGEVLRAFGYD
jgi:hypothetical protein